MTCCKIKKTLLVVIFLALPQILLLGQGIPSPKIVKNGVEYYNYTIASGDGLYGVCRKFNVTQEQILNLNPSAKNGLKSGQQLLIPIRPMVEEASYEENEFFYHTVDQGETLYSIAKTYGVEMKDIIRLNPGSNEAIKIGLMLKVPQQKTTVAVRPGAGATKERFVYHTIAPKETLFSVSKKYNISMNDLLNSNPGLTLQNFRIGKVIRIAESERIEQTIQPTPTIEKTIVTTDSLYTIKKKETLFAISKRFNVEMVLLLKKNPNLRKGAKEGMQILIPITKEIAEAHIVNENIAIAEETIEQVASLLNENAKAKPQKHVNVVLLLPFVTEAKDKTDSYRFIEYYEGFLLALEKLKGEGVSVALSVYDAGFSVEKVKSLLSTPEMLSADIIFGPVHNDQIALVAHYAKENKKLMVIPFTSKNDDIMTNPFIFQINTPQSYLYSEVAQAFCQKYAKYNIVFLDDPLIKSDKSEFIEVLTSEMDREGITYKNYKCEIDTMTNIEAYLTTEKKNLFVPTTGNNQFLEKYLPTLQTKKDLMLDYSFNLFGYPEWQVYTKDYMDAFYSLNTTIYSSFFIDYKDEAFKQFYRNFVATYSKDLRNTFPKYGILGYDSGIYFIKGINKWGQNFEMNAQKYKEKGIQTGFSFERINNWSGYINKKCFFVTYKSDFMIEQIEIGK